jgi:hypothetical protein
VIEGSLKTDAILSQGEAAFGVPSVTLWDTPELDAFLIAMNLGSKQVVIVPDADWFTNGMVSSQAWRLRSYLHKRGIDAVVAAPPLLDGEIEVDPVIGKLKGVDDYLAAGRSLDALAVLDRKCDSEVAWRALERHAFSTTQFVRAHQALTTLPLYANGKGELPKNLKACAKMLGRSRTFAQAALIDLERVGAISVEGSLEAGFKCPPHIGQHDYDWLEMHRITLAPQFWATEQHVPLRDYPTIREPAREAACVRV